MSVNGLVSMGNEAYRKGALEYRKHLFVNAVHLYVEAVKSYLQNELRKRGASKFSDSLKELRTALPESVCPEVSEEIAHKWYDLQLKQYVDVTSEDIEEARKIATKLYLTHQGPEECTEISADHEYIAGLCALDNGDYCLAIQRLAGALHWFMQIIVEEENKDMMELWKRLPERAKAIISSEEVEWCMNFKPNEASKETAQELNKIFDKLFTYVYKKSENSGDVAKLRKLVPQAVANSLTDEELLENFRDLL